MKTISSIRPYEFLLIGVFNIFFFTILDFIINLGCKTSLFVNSVCKNFKRLDMIFHDIISYDYGIDGIKTFILYVLIIFFYKVIIRKREKKTYNVWKICACLIVSVSIFNYGYGHLKYEVSTHTFSNSNDQTMVKTWKIDCQKNILITPYLVHAIDKKNMINACREFYHSAPIPGGPGPDPMLNIFGVYIEK